MKLKALLAMSTALIATYAALEVSAQSTFDNQFVSYPTYNGNDLELLVDNSGTHFCLWSPKAEDAEVMIYADGANGTPMQTLAMTPDAATGTWRASIPEKLYGKFYTFRIKTNGKWLDETPGVWAKAVGVNGNRAAIIDMASTNPAGWDTDKGPEVKSITDAVIYEMHHRDMSMHPS